MYHRAMSQPLCLNCMTYSLYLSCSPQFSLPLQSHGLHQPCNMKIFQILEQRGCLPFTWIRDILPLLKLLQLMYILCIENLGRVLPCPSVGKEVMSYHNIQWTAVYVESPQRQEINDILIQTARTSDKIVQYRLSCGQASLLSLS